MLVAGALLIAVGVAVVPAAIAGAAVAWAIHALTGLVPVLLPAAAALVVLLSECVLAIEALGTLLDRMDVTAVGPAE
jgi:hypothetical protein